MKRGYAIIALVLLAACAQQVPPEPKEPAPVMEDIEIVESEYPEKPRYDPPPTAPDVGAEEITMDITNEDFLPTTVTVNEGDTVRLVLTSLIGEITFTVPEYGIEEDIAPAEDLVVEFDADKAGTFLMYAKPSKAEGKLVVQ